MITDSLVIPRGLVGMKPGVKSMVLQSLPHFSWLIIVVIHDAGCGPYQHYTTLIRLEELAIMRERYPFRIKPTIGSC